MSQRPDDIAGCVAFWTAIQGGDVPTKQRYLKDLETEFTTGGLLQNDAIQNAVALGDIELAFDFVRRYALECADGDRLPTTQFFGLLGALFASANEPMIRDIRFVQLCGKVGLCAYWATPDRWPDCAREDALPYDFKAG